MTALAHLITTVCFVMALCGLFSVPVWAGNDVATKALSPEKYHNFAAAINFDKKTMSLDDFLEIRNNDDVTILDLRTQEAYEAGHIEGALSFGADISDEKLAKFVPGKDQTIILYCTHTLMPIRMIALTTVSLPQFIAKKYENTFQLEELWHTENHSPGTYKLPCVQGADPYASDKSPMVFNAAGECVIDDGTGYIQK